MAARSNFSGSKTETGAITLSYDSDLSPSLTGLTVAVEGSTGSVTVTVIPKGMTVARNPGADGENVIAENGMLSLDLTVPVQSVILTPANAVEYTVAWGQF